MTIQTPGGDHRELRILSKAIEAFAAHGIRGASLRDIARDADVSLTLIAHHFGNKPNLVAATAEAIRSRCEPALARLRVRLERAAGLPPEELVAAWIDYLADAFGSDASVSRLRLLQRLRTDPSLDPALLASLDVAEPCVRRALHAAYPSAPAASVDLVFRASRSALIAAFLGDDVPSASWPRRVQAAGPERALLVAHLGAGIEAALRPPGPTRT